MLITLDELHDEEDLVGRLGHILEAHDVGVVQPLQDLDLLPQLLQEQLLITSSRSST
jgi:hypothetical protein